MKDEIVKLLESTNRPGISDLIESMTDSGFFTAPASSRYHGASEGALAGHSINVYDCACKLAKAWMGNKWFKEHEDSIIICAILHDLGKCGQFDMPLYVPNMLKTGQSEVQPYKHNPELITLPHEVVSVIEATKYIDLTPEEQRAIAWHNGLYGCFKYDIQGKEDELYMIIHFADMWASRVVEK